MQPYRCSERPREVIDRPSIGNVPGGTTLPTLPPGRANSRLVSWLYFETSRRIAAVDQFVTGIRKLSMTVVAGPGSNFDVEAMLITGAHLHRLAAMNHLLEVENRALRSTDEVHCSLDWSSPGWPCGGAGWLVG